MTLKQTICASVFFAVTAIAPATYGIGSIGISGGMWCEVHCAGDQNSNPTIIIPLPADFTGDEDAYCAEEARMYCDAHGGVGLVNVGGGGQSAVPPRRRHCETTDNGSGSNEGGNQACNPERNH